MAVRSIQGEREAVTADAYAADTNTVETYLAACSAEVATCRQRGRHNYPGLTRHAMRFNEVRDDGLLERRLECLDCGCAVQVQLWEPYLRKIAGKNVPQVRFLVAYVTYQRNQYGEEYRSPGGRISSKAFREAMACQALDDEATEWVQSALRQQRKHQGRK